MGHRPEKYSAGATPGSPAATLPAAVTLDHQLRAKVTLSGEYRIALAWNFDTKTGFYSHDGGTGGYNTAARFNPAVDVAFVVLYNRDSQDLAAPRFVDRIAQDLTQLMTGMPPVPIDYISDDERLAPTLPRFSNGQLVGSYRCTLTAFPLPPTTKDPFTAAATGDIHIVAPTAKGN